MSHTKSPGTGNSAWSAPRENLFRALRLDDDVFELRAGADGDMPTLTTRFAVFNDWTEINSIFEGRFLERIAPGAFKKTIRDSGDAIKVLFQHGRDPQIGDKPLGPIRSIGEKDDGVYADVELLDTSYNRDLIPGLEAGLYGASFRFQVVKEEIAQNPKRSSYNPDGLPERTITELRLAEFGPVTFPAYAGATSGLRSITDRFVSRREERADVPSILILTQMYDLGTDFLEQEADPEDADDRDQMASILEQIEALIEAEAAEDPTPQDSPADGGRNALLHGAASRHSGRRSRTHDGDGAGRDHSAAIRLGLWLSDNPLPFTEES